MFGRRPQVVSTLKPLCYADIVGATCGRPNLFISLRFNSCGNFFEKNFINLLTMYM